MEVCKLASRLLNFTRPTDNFITLSLDAAAAAAANRASISGFLELVSFVS